VGTGVRVGAGVSVGWAVGVLGGVGEAATTAGAAVGDGVGANVGRGPATVSGAAREVERPTGNASSASFQAVARAPSELQKTPPTTRMIPMPATVATVLTGEPASRSLKADAFTCPDRSRCPCAPNSSSTRAQYQSLEAMWRAPALHRGHDSGLKPAERWAGAGGRSCNKETAPPVRENRRGRGGGPERTRTADPCDANAVLSQLSYRPMPNLSICSGGLR
jgi:hypothetical protein